MPLSAWVIGDNREVVDYFKTAGHVVDENLRNHVARVYRETPSPTGNLINGQSVGEVWASAAADIKDLSPRQLAEEMARFLRRFKRYFGHGNRHRRYAQTPADIGLQQFDITVDGYRRRWQVYVPSACRQERFEKYPLVFAFHGLSCTGEYFAANSEWHRVAEARHFLVAYPTALPRLVGNYEPVPAWQGAGFDDGAADDVKFVLLMIDRMTRAFPIDAERIYATGHSNGSAMTQRLLRCAPERFAAFAPVGYTEGDFGGGEVQPISHGVKCPVWLMKGERDIGDAARLEEGSSNAAMLRLLCGLDGARCAKPRCYQTGEYMHYMYYGDDCVPWVRFTNILGLPHAYTPEMAWMTWDDFFCKYRRKADRSIEYLG